MTGSDPTIPGWVLCLLIVNGLLALAVFLILRGEDHDDGD